MAPPHPASPVLIEDTVTEILLRVPPDEPAHLVRASFVCKLWRRILSNPAFSRRYREFHRQPPMLGFLHSLSKETAPEHMPRFVPSTSAPALFQPPPFDYDHMWTLDCRHGRVLRRAPVDAANLHVWDPITGDCLRLPQNRIAISHRSSSAVLCAVGSCNHHDCHRGPFLVVSVGSIYLRDEPYCGLMRTWACVYSSETGAWGAPISVETTMWGDFYNTKTGILIGDELYFNIAGGNNIVKFDLDKNCLSMIDAPYMYRWFDVLIVTEDRSLGFAGVWGSSLCLWSRNVDPEGLAQWVQYRVIPIDNLCLPTFVVGFADGFSVVFLSTELGTFALDLKSGLKKRISELVTQFTIFPFMSFYTPDCVTRKLQSPAETN